MSRLDLTLEKAATARRVEVITGGGGRRRWSDDEKARAVEASLAPGAVVSQVARRHGATPQQLFTWRREARGKAQSSGLPEAFVAVVVEPAASPSCSPGEASKPARARPHSIELDIAGASVFVWGGADPELVTAIIGALKATR